MLANGVGGQVGNWLICQSGERVSVVEFESSKFSSLKKKVVLSTI